MPRFFVNSGDVVSSADEKYITITGDDALHITKALRMRPGEHITVCDSERFEYDTVIRQTGNIVIADVVSQKESENEPPYFATVYQSLVKGDRFDTVLQKSTELGACRIVPTITSRCTVRLEEKEYKKKVERWQRIVFEAAKQCGRAIIPEVTMPMSFDNALREAVNTDLPLFCYEGSGTESISKIFGGVTSAKAISILIGPEGGYSEEEAELARNYGMKMTGLGRRILRTETAAPFVLSCISYEFEI